MKNNQMTSILIGALLLSTLATALMVYKWDSYYRRARKLEFQISEMNQASLVMQQLYAETAEFAKTTGNKEVNAFLASGPAKKPAMPGK